MSRDETHIINSFNEFVYAVVNKPGMYRVNNIEDLGLVIFGYIAGVARSGTISGLNEFMNNFRRFVNEHFDTTVDYDWERLIRFHAGGNVGSLELFKILFDRYIENVEKGQ